MYSKEDKDKLGLQNKGNVRRSTLKYEKEEEFSGSIYFSTPIYNGRTPLLNLEIRYKGSKTAEPQFLRYCKILYLKHMMSGKS